MTTKPASTRAQQEMQRLRVRIADTWARREALKQGLESGQTRVHSGLRALAATDRELSELDLRFKTLWDAAAASRKAAAHPAARWAESASLAPLHLDCVTAIMLKILDGKCKMGETQQQALAAIYEVVRTRPGQGLGDEVHALIGAARQYTDASLAEAIHDWRLRAEAHIPKPVMKGFKQLLRTSLPQH